MDHRRERDTCYLQRFGLPNPLIKLISAYLFYPKSDDAIGELLNYNETKIVTQNIAFYYVIDIANNVTYVNISDYVEQHLFDMLQTLLNVYHSGLKYVLGYLMGSISPEIIKQSYMHRFMDLNMLDAIVVQACTITASGIAADSTQKNKSFLADMLDIGKIWNTDDCRCNPNGDRKKLPNGDDSVSQKAISVRDIIEFFALEDNVESLDFTLKYFTRVGTNKIHFILSTCKVYIINNELPKLSKYREEYLRANA